MMVWIGPLKLRVVSAPMPRTSPARNAVDNVVENPHRLLASLPFGFGAQQIFFGHHFQDRPDVLRHAAMHQHQAVLQPLPGRGRGVVLIEDAVRRASGGRG